MGQNALKSIGGTLVRFPEPLGKSCQSGNQTRGTCQGVSVPFPEVQNRNVTESGLVAVVRIEMNPFQLR